MKRILTFAIILLTLSIVIESCAPKNNCGTKRQHKQRAKATKVIAPTM